MADQLDIEALQFMNQKSPLKSQKTIFNDIQVDLGGKRVKTRIPKSKRQSNDKRYISDEPERFVKHIVAAKESFTSYEKAREAIKKLWANDSSLKHLLYGNKGIVPSGKHIEERELNALLRTKEAQKMFRFVKTIPKKLKISIRSFEKSKASIDEEKVKTILDKIERYSQRYPRRTKLGRAFTKKEAENIFSKTREGTIKGQKVIGRLKFFKIFSKQVPRYIDPKTKRFIKL